ncbi:MAG TPA: helix-turn-helix domain-containing protein [Ktedonobacterales bacterium]|nr:helix-turn-helix domain-containing protein [Ktedonobacterales bacterium]
MALRSDELHDDLKHLNGLLTTREAAEQLRMSYWHFMHLVESKRIQGTQILGRWLFSPTNLDEYRRRKYGELEDMARLALEHPGVGLTEKQEHICQLLLAGQRPADIARDLQQSRQAVHSQIALIKEKIARLQPADAADTPADPQ